MTIEDDIAAIHTAFNKCKRIFEGICCEVRSIQ